MRIYVRWIGALLLSMLALSAFAEADRGWQPINETIHKSDYDPRSYQAITLSNGMTVLLVSDTAASKSLAALTLPIGYSEYQSMANSTMLSLIVQPWFYNQLRTEEQLGYAVFAYQMPIGRQWGIGFLLQSNSKPPAYLLQRFQAFYPQAEQRLRTMKSDDFVQYQQVMINDLKQRPP